MASEPDLRTEAYAQIAVGGPVAEPDLVTNFGPQSRAPSKHAL
jgi:hypothetical protein